MLGRPCTPHNSSVRVGTEVNEATGWSEVGRRIRDARQRMRPELSKRAAAKKAGINEATWRHLEDGEVRTKAGTHPPNPSNAYLEAAALAVELDPVEIFSLAGRLYDGPYTAPVVTTNYDGLIERMGAVEVRLDRVEQQVSRLEKIEAKVDQLLESEER